MNHEVFIDTQRRFGAGAVVVAWAWLRDTLLHSWKELHFAHTAFLNVLDKGRSHETCAAGPRTRKFEQLLPNFTEKLFLEAAYKCYVLMAVVHHRVLGALNRLLLIHVLFGTVLTTYSIEHDSNCVGQHNVFSYQEHHCAN